jgi:hypothetical protein
MSMRRMSLTPVSETVASQRHCRPANSVLPSKRPTSGKSREILISLMVFIAIQSARARSRSIDVECAIWMMPLKTAIRPMETIARATMTSSKVNPPVRRPLITAHPVR